jgi:hypothetical protein
LFVPAIQSCAKEECKAILLEKAGYTLLRLSRRTFQRFLFLGACSQFVPSELFAFAAASQDLLQPYEAQVKRLLSGLEAIGEPLPPDEVSALHAIFSSGPGNGAVERIGAILDRHVLLNVDINPAGLITISRGQARAQLVEQGWRTFLIRVTNQANETSKLEIHSAQAWAMGRVSDNDTAATQDFSIGAVDAVVAESRWIALENWSKPPLQPALSGLDLEYRILQIYSRDRGRRAASLQALTGAAEQNFGFRSTTSILFEALPSAEIKTQIHDESGAPATASLLITDKLGRVYPEQGKRAVPDLWFQSHVYRHDGESIRLADGTYSIEYGRGPEYLRKRISIDVSGASPESISLPLERWILPSRYGYYSGDTHIHAAGCAHYASPSEGVRPEVMLRQADGEALDVGAVLTWGPGWYYQSQFFSGHVDHQGTTTADHSMLRYDVEVSGFPSSHCGHLVLLRLTEEKFPGAKAVEEWPSWNIPVLKWARSQGAVVGYAHSGMGLVVDSTELPNYLMPAFDLNGANECIVDVTHPGMIDFMSGCDTWPFVELNFWYHVLNCGFVLAFAGETDFPCLTDDRVGGGRSYVKLDVPPSGDKGYSDWVNSGMVDGHSYFGDGRSHIFDFSIEGASAESEGRQHHLEKQTTLRLRAQICARLEPEITEPTELIRNASPYDQPYWHLERARIGKSRKVAVELVVNGKPVQHTEIEADGTLQAVTFDRLVSQSSWIAMRIYPSSHTNPIYVHVSAKPIRASKESADWCRRAVDVCWQRKSPRIRASELEEARVAYDHARSTYDRIVSESEV